MAPRSSSLENVSLSRFKPPFVRIDELEPDVDAEILLEWDLLVEEEVNKEEELLVVDIEQASIDWDRVVWPAPRFSRTGRHGNGRHPLYK